ncbi:hypothetical protein FRC09_011091 [Ceratobasidium sp. 395]|nr:hypothetical protein FRC09_011091 [Ceratobasidium sp. 395]
MSPAHPVGDVIEIFSSSDPMSSSDTDFSSNHYATHFNYKSRRNSVNGTSTKYRRTWAKDTAKSSRRKPNHSTTTQDDTTLDDSEAEVEALIRVENEMELINRNNVGADQSRSHVGNGHLIDTSPSKSFCHRGSSAHSSVSGLKSSVARSSVGQPGCRTPVAYRSKFYYPTSSVRSSQQTVAPDWTSSTPSLMDIPALREYDRIPAPGDWTGAKHGEINYIMPPMDLLFLLNEGGQWSFTRTAPTSNCRNRIVGDIHFTPGKMEGYEYWVCCAMPGSQFGRGWIPWRIQNSHPLYPELALYHFNDGTPPVWALKLDNL